MGFFTNLFTSSKPISTTVAPPIILPKQWRTNMWVMVAGNIGILTDLNETCSVDLVNPQTGETTSTVQVSLSGLRQARFGEIPACRKIGVTPEQGLELGYGA